MAGQLCLDTSSSCRPRVRVARQLSLCRRCLALCAPEILLVTSDRLPPECIGYWVCFVVCS